LRLSHLSYEAGLLYTEVSALCCLRASAWLSIMDRSGRCRQSSLFTEIYRVSRHERFSCHGYAVVEVNGRRLKATPVFDAKLCAKFGVAPLDFDGENDALFQQYHGKGNRFMEYIRERGEFDEFPFKEVMRGLAEMYPHLTGKQIDGDFMNETPAL
jgi:hypothetical protein